MTKNAAISRLKKMHSWMGDENQLALEYALNAIDKYEKIQDLFERYAVSQMKELDLTSGFENALCEVIENDSKRVNHTTIG